MLANSYPDSGHSWDLDQRRNSTKLYLINGTENGFILKAVTRYFVPPAPWELIFRTIMSVNQLSIYGAVADSCEESSDDSEVAVKPAANEDSESVEIPTELPVTDLHINAESQGNLLQDCEHKFEHLPEDLKLSKLCCDAGLKIVA